MHINRMIIHTLLKKYSRETVSGSEWREEVEFSTQILKNTYYQYVQITKGNPFK